MKDILEEKIKLDIKLHKVQLLQSYYSKRMDWAIYSELLAKINKDQKSLLSLIESTSDFTIRNKIENQQYPFSYWKKHLNTEED